MWFIQSLCMNMLLCRIQFLSVYCWLTNHDLYPVSTGFFWIIEQIQALNTGPSIDWGITQESTDKLYRVYIAKPRAAQIFLSQWTGDHIGTFVLWRNHLAVEKRPNQPLPVLSRHTNPAVLFNPLFSVLQCTEVTSPHKRAGVIYAAVREGAAGLPGYCRAASDANIKALLFSGFTVPQTEKTLLAQSFCEPEGGEKALEVREGDREREEDETAGDYGEG